MLFVRYLGASYSYTWYSAVHGLARVGRLAASEPVGFEKNALLVSHQVLRIDIYLPEGGIFIILSKAPSGCAPRWSNTRHQNRARESPRSFHLDRRAVDSWQLYQSVVAGCFIRILYHQYDGVGQLCGPVRRVFVGIRGISCYQRLICYLVTTFIPSRVYIRTWYNISHAAGTAVDYLHMLSIVGVK